ncbi:atypical kinase COQ8B, mitochondrial-like isoform X2 [Oscarella lobularis]|uniref:atypical kinase COQ8B, mitochondrial-like isoform X2 n=1 Tax=Oscarella lobularis TaxID=121494 RepID=UPI0033132664
MKRTNSALGVLSGLSLVIKSIVQEQSAQTRLVWRASSVRDIAKSMRESASTAAEYVQPWKPPQDSPAAILERENGDEELPRESVEENSDKMASNEETRTEDSDLGMRHDEQATEHTTQTLNSRSKERAVPASRMGRLWNFGGLAAGLGAGALAEQGRRILGLKKPTEIDMGWSGSSAFLSEKNVERIVNTMCRVRGAALKLGQMISIQDTTLVSPEVQKLFERVRNSADFMPLWQMNRVLEAELGKEWRSKLKEFDDHPIAAASIGQVHRGVLHNGQEVAIKIQYPGVSKSIDSDIDNLMTILNVADVFPKGLYVDNAIAVARVELAWETDYIREAECTERFRSLLANDPLFVVPRVVPELSSKQILTTEMIYGMPMDQAVALDQETRNELAYQLLNLCLREVFEFKFMQTDPNWSNFFYNAETRKILGLVASIPVHLLIHISELSEQPLIKIARELFNYQKTWDF